MADNHQLPNLVEVMDLLWFHHTILFSEYVSLRRQLSKLITETYPMKSPSISSTPPSTPLSEEEISSDSPLIPLQVCTETNNKRPTKSDFDVSQSRSRSSSPCMKKGQKHLTYSNNDRSRRILQKTTSCKSLWELEYEEVKGFMDLGFTFDKEYLTPRMMSVIPGLQRLGKYNDHEDEGEDYRCGMEAAEKKKFKDDEEIEVEKEEKRGVRRPYLSEAWLIKRPDSPLLNLRLPRASATAEMKKHLRFWARTVASVVRQES
ncbi:PREDICTED: uncharacterized protein LOC104594811 [Nelumbo nucifera]|uniref:Uncharacterized protein LOC104594811 n=1 Tax=Nelumbo nucifera TaxID=4432 RepID=A0A1U7ZP58_NELNU|nr:PREDICTED: uncharacterized protein LOC104594811 [Nelumbo nucifera]